MGSENPSGAGNQQERPGIEQWVVGFVDGEGCFSISVVRNVGMQSRLASPARVLCDPGGVIEAGSRTPRRGVRVRLRDRERPGTTTIVNSFFASQ